MSEHTPPDPQGEDKPGLEKVSNWARSLRLWVIAIGAAFLTLVEVTGPLPDWRIVLLGAGCVALCGAFLYFGRSA